MIGDSETVSHDEFLKSLVEYLHKEGEVRSAQEFVDGKTKLYITIIGIIYVEGCVAGDVGSARVAYVLCV